MTLVFSTYLGFLVFCLCTTCSYSKLPCLFRIMFSKPFLRNAPYATPFPSYLTHYSRAKGRLSALLPMLASHGISPNIVVGFDRDDMTHEEIKCILNLKDVNITFHPSMHAPFIVRRPRKRLEAGVVSLFLKHTAVYVDMLKTSQPWSMVLEDDAYLSGHVNNLTLYLTDLVQQLPPAWDFVMLGTCFNIHGDIRIGKPIFSKSAQDTYIVPSQGSRCTHAYLVSLAGALKMISWLPMTAPIDLQINVASRYVQINTFWSEPPLFTQQGKGGSTGIRTNVLEVLKDFPVFDE